jgi:hypothetical protein
MSAVTGSSDVLRFAGWYASVSYRTDAPYLGGSAAVTFNRFMPVATLSASTAAVPYRTLRAPVPGSRVDSAGNVELFPLGERYWEKRHQVALSVSYPYTFKTTIFGRYALTFRQPLHELPADVWRDDLPVQGRVGALSGGWVYAYGQPTPYAISPEDARIFSLVGSVLHPWLGTSVRGESGEAVPLAQVQLTTELREYLVNPWVPNHVLAVRLAGGLTLGGTDFLGLYSLGGNIGDGSLATTPDEFRMLRGFPIGADIGDRYWLGSAEYRFPIVRFDRGVGALPVFFRALSGAVFVDSGNAFTRVETAADLVDGSLVGVGAEMRLSVVVGWAVGLTGRLGYAVGLTPGGRGPLDPGSLYLQLGSSF